MDEIASSLLRDRKAYVLAKVSKHETTEEEIFRMIAEADAENTGEISYAQFKHVIAEQKKN